MQVVLIRHGETASNRDRLALGRLDLPLTDAGLQQAKLLGLRLAGDTGARRIEAVYSSPLLRARQTADAIAALLGAGVIVEDGLIEMDVGEMEGLTGAELRERHPEFMKAWFGPGAADAVMPGGESLARVQERASRTLEAIRERHEPEAAVAAVTHNFVIRTLVCTALGVPLGDFRRFEIGLASLTRIDFRGPRTLITSLNETCHLE
jgi:broad specificity phosphatase PhoE